MEPDLVEPIRPWSELIALSTQRGKQIRRRRQAIWASGPLGGALIAVAVFVTGGNVGADSLRVVPPAAPQEPLPTPAAAREAASQHPPVVGTTLGLDGSAPSAAGGTADRSAGGRQPLRSVDAMPPRAASAAGRAGWHLPQVSFTDVAGDGTPRSAPVGTANDPAYDITRVAYTATSAGLQLDMWLAGNNAPDAYYTATLTDPSSACTLTVVLGGSWDDYYTDSCGSTVTMVPNVADPTADHLRAVVPFALFPADVDPTHTLNGLSGITKSMNSLGASATYDTASSSLTIRPKQ